MYLIKEADEIDLYVDSRPMTKEDEKAISDYIKADKLKQKTKTGNKTFTSETTFRKLKGKYFESNI